MEVGKRDKAEILHLRRLLTEKRRRIQMRNTERRGMRQREKSEESSVERKEYDRNEGKYFGKLFHVSSVIISMYEPCYVFSYYLLSDI